MDNSKSPTESVLGLTVLVSSVLLILKKERRKVGFNSIRVFSGQEGNSLWIQSKTNLHNSVEEWVQGNINIDRLYRG